VITLYTVFAWSSSDDITEPKTWRICVATIFVIMPVMVLIIYVHTDVVSISLVAAILKYIC
jgi:hypothetical protein